MGVKIQFFKLGHSLISEDASKFMSSVSVIENGVIMGQEYVGILYKDRDDVGMAKENLVTAASGELAKSQKQFITQEGLVRAYKDMIVFFENQHKAAQVKADEAQKELDVYVQTYDPSLENEMAGLTKDLQDATVKHQQAPKKDKEPFLKRIYEVNEKIKIVQPVYDKYKNEFDAKSNEISAAMGGFAVEAANVLGKVKEYQGFLDDAVAARDHAGVFIISTKKLIADLLTDQVPGVQ